MKTVLLSSYPQNKAHNNVQGTFGEDPDAKGCCETLPEAGTYNNVMLAQHGHLPQRLVGESVKVVGPVLPPAPALLPACMYQLLCKQAWNPAWVRAPPGAPF